MGSQTVGHNWATELRSNRREIRQAYFPSFMIIIHSFRIPSSSFWVLYWYHGTHERNRESTWISIQIMQFASQGLLATESQFCDCLFLLPAAVALGFPEHKLLLFFSRISNTFLGNFRTTTYPSNLIFLICKEQPVLTQTSISTFSSQLTFGQNFHQLWLLPANHSYHSFYVLNNPVRSVISLRIV